MPKRGGKPRKHDGPTLPGILYRQLDGFDDGGTEGRERAQKQSGAKSDRKARRAAATSTSDRSALQGRRVLGNGRGAAARGRGAAAPGRRGARAAAVGLGPAGAALLRRRPRRSET